MIRRLQYIPLTGNLSVHMYMYAPASDSHCTRLHTSPSHQQAITPHKEKECITANGNPCCASLSEVQCEGRTRSYSRGLRLHGYVVLL